MRRSVIFVFAMVITLSGNFIVAAQQSVLSQDVDLIALPRETAVTPIQEKTIDEIAIDGLLAIVSDVGDDVGIRQHALTALVSTPNMKLAHQRKVVTALVAIARDKANNTFEIRAQAISEIQTVVAATGRSQLQSGGQFNDPGVISGAGPFDVLDSPVKPPAALENSNDKKADDSGDPPEEAEDGKQNGSSN